MTPQQLDLLSAGGRSRPSDPSTSKQAAELVRLFGAKQRRQVLRFIVDCEASGSTDYEVSAATGILPNAVATRRKELQARGLVERTERRRRTLHASAIVWQASSSAAQTLRDWESV